EGKAVQEAVGQLLEANPRLQLSAVNIPIQGLQVWMFDDGAKALAAQLKLYRSLSPSVAYGSAVLKEAPVVQEKTEKHGGMDFHAVTLVWDLDKTVEKQGGGRELGQEEKARLKEYIKSLMGEELHAWVGTDGKNLIQVRAKDWASAEKLLDQYSQGK